MKRTALLFSAILSMCLSATSETINLKNGDRITGAIVKSDGKAVEIKTEYAGVVKIDWSAIAELKTDTPLYVSSAGKTLKGNVTASSEQVVVATDSGETVVPLASLTAVRNEAEQNVYLRATHPGLLQGWSGLTNFGFALARGNSETTNYTLRFDAARKGFRDKLTLFASSVYATNDSSDSGDVTARNASGGLRYDRDATKKLFGYGSGQFDYDELQLLDLRSTVGGGGGLHVIANARTTLDFLGGGAYTRESYDTGEVRDLATLSFGNELSHQLLKSTLVKQRFFIYPDLSETGEYRFELNLTGITKINKWLGWQVGAYNHYISNPIDARKSNDMTVTTGLSVSFQK